MELLNGEIFDIREPLQTLLEKQLPVKVSYDLAKMAIKLAEEYQAIEKVRYGLVKKYGEPNKDNPNQYSVDLTGDKYPKFVKEFKELMNQTVEVAIKKIRLPEEVDGKPLEIEPKILVALEKLVEV